MCATKKNNAIHRIMRNAIDQFAQTDEVQTFTFTEGVVNISIQLLPGHNKCGAAGVVLVGLIDLNLGELVVMELKIHI